MSTATQAPRGNGTATVERTALDTAIQETEKRKKTIIGEAASILMIPPGKVCDLLRNVWKVSNGQEPLRDEEMFAGLSLISRYQLDPIAREIYVTRDNKGRLLTIVSVDGWIKILDRTDHYDGFEQDIHEDKGRVAWIETRIFSSKRTHPAVYRAFAEEYAKIAGFMNDKIPIHMLGIFSLRHAARRFTPIGGHVVTEEEAAYMGAGVGQSEPSKPASKADQLADALTQQIQKSPAKMEPTPDTHMVGGPPYKELFRQYMVELNQCQTEAECRVTYDKWAGPDAPCEWPADLATAMCSARDDRIVAVMKPVKRPAKGQLFDGTASAVEAGH